MTLGILGVVVVLMVIGAILVANLPENTNTAQAGRVKDKSSQPTPRDKRAAGGTSDNGAPSTSREKQTQDKSSRKTASSEQGKTIVIGETLKLGKTAWTVTDAKYADVLKDPTDPTGKYGGENKQGNFVIVGFEFTNNGNEAITLDSSLLTLLDSKNREYQVDTDNMFYVPQDKSIFLEQVNPGVTKAGTAIFSVAPNTRTFHLGVSEGFFGTNTGKIELGTLESGSGTDTGSTSTESTPGSRPSSMTASSTSSSAPDASGNTISYSAENAVDGQNSTAWNVDGDGIGQSITLHYDQPITVSRIGMIPGYDKVDSTDGTHRFYQLYVVKKARIEFSDGTSVEANFERDPSMQYTDVPDTTTDTVKITILDTYPPGNSPEGGNYPYTLDKAAISEIQVEGP